MTDEDLWGTDAGIVTDYEGTIVDSFFLLNPESKFGDPQTQLHLKFATNDDRVVEERWNCGPDWVSNDGGMTVTHPTKKKFNQNSQAGKFVKAVMDCVPLEVLMAQGPPTTAESWLGMQFFMEATTNTGKNQTTGEEWSSTKNYPTKFLGVGAAEGGQGISPVSSDPFGSLSDTAVEVITKYAQTLTHGEWVDKVLEVEGVMGNDDLVRMLTDEAGLYTQLREG